MGLGEWVQRIETKVIGRAGAVNFQSMGGKLAAKMRNDDIVPYYSDYTDMGRTSAIDIATDDVCLMYDPRTAAELNGRIT